MVSRHLSAYPHLPHRSLYLCRQTYNPLHIRPDNSCRNCGIGASNTLWALPSLSSLLKHCLCFFACTCPVDTAVITAITAIIAVAIVIGHVPNTHREQVRMYKVYLERRILSYAIFLFCVSQAMMFLCIHVARRRS